MANKIFIDCGTGSGNSIKKFKQTYDLNNEYKYYSFEKDLILYEKLKSDVELNDVNLSFMAISGISNSYNDVDIINLSDVINKFDINDEITINLDVEGSEIDILSDLIFNNLIERIKKIYCKFYSNDLIKVNLLKSKYNITEL